METNWIIWLILGFAAYRVTRFLIIDTLFEASRAKFHVYLVNKQGRGKFFYEKLIDLTSCTYCAGFWVSLLVYSLWFWECPVDFNQVDWISVFAIAGVQSLLHSWEPEDA